jgi:hypothetical protein
MVIGAERDLIDEGRSPEYIPELVLIAAQPLRSNRFVNRMREVLPILGVNMVFERLKG